jgi:hypothetical protein
MLTKLLPLLLLLLLRSLELHRSKTDVKQTCQRTVYHVTECQEPLALGRLRPFVCHRQDRLSAKDQISHTKHHPFLGHLARKQDIK